MALHTKCMTPGAVFSTQISTSTANEDFVNITVTMPNKELRGLSEEDAMMLERNIHNAMELVLAPYFKS